MVLTHHELAGVPSPAGTEVITTMAECNEARLPLTNESVQKWARANFPGPFRALPRTPRLTWIEFDESSFALSRAIWRSLGRSSHKQLLDIGAYAPGPDLNEEEPTDRVAAHVHEDEAEVSFYRIVETPYGDELQSVKSTSTVAFSAPFCNVGGSEAIHRVSALIRYYFLAAGHVKELLRSKLDPTMFTRNFKDACSWIENGGERPIAMPSRRLSGSTMVTSQDNVAIRPKRSSTICAYEIAAGPLYEINTMLTTPLKLPFPDQALTLPMSQPFIDQPQIVLA